MLPWLLCALLLLAVLALGIKVHLLQRAMDALARDLGERLSADTNQLLSVSVRDAHARRLAAGLNRHLRLLRAQRRQYLNGDRELKDAVTNISHDLRTPLTAICGYLVLLEHEKQSEKTARYLGVIRDRAELLTQLTEELFRYSVILSAEGGGQKEAVVLNDVLEESIASFYTALRQRNIVPRIRIPEEKVIRPLDRAALLRVFSNLLNNAIKYSDGDLEIALWETGEIRFTNTAAGLDEVQVGKLFDRFYTVEAARRSTGLGLAIAKTLVEQMGGAIGADYEENRLTIRVAFPESGAQTQ